MTRAGTSAWVPLFLAAWQALCRLEMTTPSTLQPQLIAATPSLAAAHTFLSRSCTPQHLARRHVELVALNKHSLFNLIPVAMSILQRAISLGLAQGDPALARWSADARMAVTWLMGLLVNYFAILAFIFESHPNAAAQVAGVAFFGSPEFCHRCDSMAVLLPGPLKVHALMVINTVLAVFRTTFTLAVAMQQQLCASTMLPALCNSLTATVGGGGELDDVPEFLTFFSVVSMGDSHSGPHRTIVHSQISKECAPLRRHVVRMPGVYSFLMACMHLPHDRQTHAGYIRHVADAGSLLLYAARLWLRDAPTPPHLVVVTSDSSSSACDCGSDATLLPPFFPSVADIADVLQFGMAHPDVVIASADPTRMVKTLLDMAAVFSLMLVRLTADDLGRAFMPIATFARKAVAAALAHLNDSRIPSSSRSTSHISSCEGLASPLAPVQIPEPCAAAASECEQAHAAGRPTEPAVDVASGTCGRSRVTVAATAASVAHSHSSEPGSLLPLASAADGVDDQHGGRGSLASDAVGATKLLEAALQLLLLVLWSGSQDGTVDFLSRPSAWHRSRCLWVLRSGLLPACDEFLRTVASQRPDQQAMGAMAAGGAEAEGAAAAAAAGRTAGTAAAAAAATSLADGECNTSVAGTQSDASPLLLCLLVALVTARNLPDSLEAQLALLRLGATVRKSIVLQTRGSLLASAGSGLRGSLRGSLRIVRVFVSMLQELCGVSEAEGGLPNAILDVYALQLLPAVVRLAKACLRADPGRCHDDSFHEILRLVALGDAALSDQCSLFAGVPSLMHNMLTACGDGSATASSAASFGAAEAQHRARSTASAVEALLVTYDVEALPPVNREVLQDIRDRVEPLLGRPTTQRDSACDQRLDCSRSDFSWDGAARAAREDAEPHGPVSLGCWWRGCTNLAGRSEAELRLRRCSRCRSARYCSELCQRRAWVAGHRAACSKSRKIPPAE